MNTQDMRDDSVDAIFKEAANSVKIQFEENSWEVLERRLDFAALMTRLIWLSIIGCIILIICIPIYFNYHKRPTLEINYSRDVLPAGNLINHNQTLSTGANSSRSTTANHSILHKKINDNQKPFKQESSTLNYYLSPVNKKIAVPDVTEENNDYNLQNKELKNNLEFLHAIQIKSEEVPLYPQKDLRLNAIVISDRKEEEKIQPALILKFGMGPELNAVKFNKPGMGMIEGIGLEYFISNRISVESGMYHVKKNYAVKDGEYIVPDPSFIYYGKSPEHISIKCHVIDVPFNIRYAVFVNPSNRITAGAGLSSYLMLTEEYSYQYGTGNNIRSRRFIIRNENQHYLGILNFTISYAKPVTPGILLEIDPYIKIPLQGIAAADVHLFSYGTILSLNFILK